MVWVIERGNSKGAAVKHMKTATNTHSSSSSMFDEGQLPLQPGSAGRWLLPDADGDFDEYAQLLHEVHSTARLWSAYFLVQGGMLLLLTLRLLRVWSFQSKLGIITNTLSKAAPQLVHLLLIITSCIVLFAGLSVIGVGDRVPYASSYTSAFEETFSTLLGLGYIKLPDVFPRALQQRLPKQILSVIIYYGREVLFVMIFMQYFMATLGSVFMELKKQSKRSRTCSIAADISADVLPELRLLMKHVLQHVRQGKSSDDPNNAGNTAGQQSAHGLRLEAPAEQPASRHAHSPIATLQEQLLEVMPQELVAGSSISGASASVNADNSLVIEVCGKLLDLSTLQQLLRHVSCKPSSAAAPTVPAAPVRPRPPTERAATIAEQDWHSSDGAIVVTAVPTAATSPPQHTTPGRTAVHRMLKISKAMGALKQEQQQNSELHLHHPPFPADQPLLEPNHEGSSVAVTAAGQLLRSLGKLVSRDDYASAALTLESLAQSPPGHRCQVDPRAQLQLQREQLTRSYVDFGRAVATLTTWSTSMLRWHERMVAELTDKRHENWRLLKQLERQQQLRQQQHFGSSSSTPTSGVRNRAALASSREGLLGTWDSSMYSQSHAPTALHVACDPIAAAAGCNTVSYTDVHAARPGRSTASIISQAESLYGGSSSASNSTSGVVSYRSAGYDGSLVRLTCREGEAAQDLLWLAAPATTPAALRAVPVTRQRGMAEAGQTNQAYQVSRATELVGFTALSSCQLWRPPARAVGQKAAAAQ